MKSCKVVRVHFLFPQAWIILTDTSPQEYTIFLSLILASQIDKLDDCIPCNLSIFLILHLSGEEYLSNDLDESYGRILCSGTENWNMTFNLTHSDCIWQINVKRALNKLGSSSEFYSSTELWSKIFPCSVPKRWKNMVGNIHGTHKRAALCHHSGKKKQERIAISWFSENSLLHDHWNSNYFKAHHILNAILTYV